MVQPEDAPAIQAIYARVVTDTASSFEEMPPTVEEIGQRIAATLRAYPYLVAVREGQVVGYAYASQHRARTAGPSTSRSTSHKANVVLAWVAASTKRCCPSSLDKAIVRPMLAFHSPTRVASDCMSGSVSGTSALTQRWVTSSANGTMWGNGTTSSERRHVRQVKSVRIQR